MKRVGRRILVMGADRWLITTARHNRHTTTAKVSFAHSTENTKELNETNAKGKWAREKETKGQQRSKKQLSDSALNKFVNALCDELRAIQNQKETSRERRENRKTDMIRAVQLQLGREYISI
jgi:hypothetical protein